VHYNKSIDWFNTVEMYWQRNILYFSTFIAHISVLSNAHGALPMFWPVLRRCHILR
jgi:hypothetical protein